MHFYSLSTCLRFLFFYSHFSLILAATASFLVLDTFNEFNLPAGYINCNCQTNAHTAKCESMCVQPQQHRGQARHTH